MISPRRMHPNLNRARHGPLPTRGSVVDGALRAGPLRLDDGPADAEPRARPMTTCPVCESPVFVDGFCMNCWEVC
jgi:hypothetical protein